MMSADLFLVDGFGINATGLEWKSEEEIDEILEERGHNDLRNYIESVSSNPLLYCNMNGEIYIYAESVYPIARSADQLLTKEELAIKIQTAINPFIVDGVTLEEVTSILGGVFDWEVC